MSWYDGSTSVNKVHPRRILIDAQKLYQMYVGGVLIKDIAREFNVSQATIKRHIAIIIPDGMRRNKGKTSNPDDMFNREIIRLYVEDYLTTHQIANVMECKPGKVSSRLKKCGVELRKKKGKNLFKIHPKTLNRKKKIDYPIQDTKEFNESFKLLYLLNFEIERMSELLGIHEETVIRRIAFLRTIHKFKLRSCKYCERFFRMIITDSQKNGNVCPLCNGSSRNIILDDVNNDFLEKIKSEDRGTHGG